MVVGLLLATKLGWANDFVQFQKLLFFCWLMVALPFVVCSNNGRAIFFIQSLNFLRGVGRRPVMFGKLSMSSQGAGVRGEGSGVRIPD